MPTNDRISERERRRANATNFARASVGLEGFRLTKDDEDLTRRYINGEIDLVDALEFVRNAVHIRQSCAGGSA